MFGVWGKSITWTRALWEGVPRLFPESMFWRYASFETVYEDLLVRSRVGYPAECCYRVMMREFQRIMMEEESSGHSLQDPFGGSVEARMVREWIKGKDVKWMVGVWRWYPIGQP